MQCVDLVNSPEHLALLESFYDDLFVPGFPDPDERESKDTLWDNLVKRAAGFYGNNNYRILLGLEDGRPVAGCIGDYMHASNCGAIEYIIVSEDLRGRGLGRTIHDHTVEALMADAQRAGESFLDAVMIEINDPYLAPPELDNADPFDRLKMWDRWGYKRLDFPYQQPALSPEQSAIDYLLLGVKILRPQLSAGFPTEKARQMVVDYLVWANRLNEFERDPFYDEIVAYTQAHRFAQLHSLFDYAARASTSAS